MEWLIAVVAVAALGVAAMAAAGGMGQMSRDPVYDTYRQDLPTGGALTAEELRSIRFGVTLWVCTNVSASNSSSKVPKPPGSTTKPWAYLTNMVLRAKK